MAEEEEEGFSDNSLLLLAKYYNSKYADGEDANIASRGVDGPSSETREKTSGGTGHSSKDTGSNDKRGITLMKAIDKMRARGKTLQVEFDDEGHALGKNGSAFRSYLGVLARTKVPITIGQWKHVPADIKNHIWDKASAVFKGIENRKKQELKNAGIMWRMFKTHLTSRYITKKTAPEDEDPLQKYPFLTEEVWKEFVAARQTSEFQAHSELQRRRQSKNQCPHTMSRKGYALVDEMIRKEQVDEPKTPADGASATTINIPRHVKWVKGRIDRKTGEYKTPAIEKVAQKIDELQEKAAQGSFTAFGRHDILTEALGTDERSGRVRGMGGDVGLKQAFPEEKRCHFSSQEELDHCIKQRVKEEVMSVLTQLGFQPAMLPSTSGHPSGEVEFNQTPQPQPTVQQFTSGHPSVEVELNQTPRALFNPSMSQDSQTSDPFQEIPEGGIKCSLKIEEDGKHRVVAIGKVLKGSTHHCAPLPHDQVRVIIENPVDPNADVPVPTDEVQRVMQALRGFISWPKSLIDLNVEEFDQPHSKHKAEHHNDKLEEVVDSGNMEVSTLETKKTASLKPSSLPKTCRRLYSYAKLMSSEGSIMIPMDHALLGIEYSLCMTKEYILQFLRMEALSAACMELYIRCLAGMCSELDIECAYGFLHPNTMAAGNQVSKRASYMCDKMKADEKDYFFAPYLDASPDVQHWMLCIIYPKDNRVYWLDPSAKKVCKDIKETIDFGLKDYRMNGVARKSRSRSKTEWIKIKCPIQTGDTLCGYYVMRYMRDIIFSQMDANVARFQQCFHQCNAYSQEQIDEVREQWADYLLDCISNLQHESDDDEDL